MLDQGLNKKPKALIVEDDEELQDVFSEALFQAGYTITLYSDGESALEYLDQEKPQLLLLDLHLPKRSGREILTHIRSSERLSDISVIIASADPSLADILSQEADLVLIKPISFTQLRDLARRMRKTKHKA